MGQMKAPESFNNPHRFIGKDPLWGNVSILWRGKWVKDIWADGILFQMQRQFKNGSCLLDTPLFLIRFPSLN